MTYDLNYCMFIARHIIIACALIYVIEIHINNSYGLRTRKLEFTYWLFAIIAVVFFFKYLVEFFCRVISYFCGKCVSDRSKNRKN